MGRKLGDDQELLYKQEYFDIKQACIEIRKTLGNGFLEKVYEKALKCELESKGYIVDEQKEIDVLYKGNIVGNYFADLIVNQKIIIELKCVCQISDYHKAQLLNYLVATGYRLGILINFPGDKNGFEIQRIIK